MTFTIRKVQPSDEAPWKALYAAYRAFYQLEPDAAVVDRVWRWLSAQELGMVGLVALGDGGEPVALANLREFARPSSGTVGLYLDDLFTAAAARGRGAATALLARAAVVAADGGHSVVRWITADDNATARRVYDASATATRWVTYDMPPARA